MSGDQEEWREGGSGEDDAHMNPSQELQHPLFCQKRQQTQSQTHLQLCLHFEAGQLSVEPIFVVPLLCPVFISALFKGHLGSA